MNFLRNYPSLNQARQYNSAQRLPGMTGQSQQSRGLGRLSSFENPEEQYKKALAGSSSSWLKAQETITGAEEDVTGSVESAIKELGTPTGMAEEAWKAAATIPIEVVDYDYIIEPYWVELNKKSYEEWAAANPDKAQSDPSNLFDDGRLSSGIYMYKMTEGSGGESPEKFPEWYVPYYATGLPPGQTGVVDTYYITPEMLTEIQKADKQAREADQSRYTLKQTEDGTYQWMVSGAGQTAMDALDDAKTQYLAAVLPSATEVYGKGMKSIKGQETEALTELSGYKGDLGMSALQLGTTYANLKVNVPEELEGSEVETHYNKRRKERTQSFGVLSKGRKNG